MKKQSTPTVKLIDQSGNKLFVVTDTISGNIGGKAIAAKRGDRLYLTVDAAKVFKDKILEI